MAESTDQLRARWIAQEEEKQTLALLLHEQPKSPKARQWLERHMLLVSEARAAFRTWKRQQLS